MTPIDLHIAYKAFLIGWIAYSFYKKEPIPTELITAAAILGIIIELN